MISKDAYGGESVEEQCYDVDHNSLHSDRRWPNMDGRVWTSAGTWQYQMIYHPNCIKFLKKHLAKIQNRVLKKGKVLNTENDDSELSLLVSSNQQQSLCTQCVDS